MTSVATDSVLCDALSSATSPASATKPKRPRITPEQKAAERRRRRRVDPAKRKRVAVACDSCKKRKQKCDGQDPCNICLQRGFSCSFPPNLSEWRRPSANPRTESPVQPVKRNRHSPSTSRDTSNSSRSTPAVTDEEVVAVGEGNPRLLRDPRGHLRFIGESGAHSFLEQIRQLFRQTSGESTFTQDMDRFNLVDGPAHVASERTLQLPSRAVADELVEIFAARVQPFSYVFHMEDFRRVLDETYENPIECPRSWLCLIQLVFALASVYRSDTDSGKFFASGLGLCQDCIEDGDFWIVQAYLLISLYYQLTCKRNAFWIAIAMAIRFAQALGLHRQCVNRALPLRDCLLRQRVWRTLYIHDRFHSAALGRPCAIEDGDWDDTEPADESEADRLSVEMARISSILGDICRQVYRPRTISSEAASELARRLQQWSDSLPPEMSAHSLLRNKAVPYYDRHVLQRLHLAHLNAVILLTRPFFFYVVATAAASQTPADVQKNHAPGTAQRLAQACVLSASRSVEIVQTLFVDNARPIRPPFMIYFMFLAGLILLLDAYRDKSLLLNPSIGSVKTIIASYSHLDPSAKRYHRIFAEMEMAIINDKDKRQQSQTKDIIGELLYGNGASAREAVSAHPIFDTKSPGDISLSQFLMEGKIGFTPGLDDTFNFDFDSSAYWDSMMAGDGDFRGTLLNPEF